MTCLENITCERRTYCAKPHTHVHNYAQLIRPVSGRLSITVGEADFAGDNEVIYVRRITAISSAPFR